MAHDACVNLWKATFLVFGLIGAVLTGPNVNYAQADRGTERPNIIVILTDDQGYGDVGFHGNDQIETPNIDRLAKESAEFTHFYVSPVCAPTRASLMTGRYHYRTGVLHTSRGGAKMHGNEVTLAEILAEAGYQTGIFGKWHLGDNYPMRPMDQGFHESLVHTAGGINQTPDLPNNYFDPKLWHNGQARKYNGYSADIFTEKAIQFIEENRSNSFFVYLPLNTPHTPLIVDQKYSSPYLEKSLPPRMAKLYGMITNIDDNVGRLLEKLQQLNLEEDTIVIFMGDNGPGGGVERYNAGLRSGKGSVYDGGIRVPFLIRRGGQIPKENKISRPVAHIDLLPTLLDAAGVPMPEKTSIDGKSLMPLLKGEDVKWKNRMLYFQWHRGLNPQRYQNVAVRSDQYKLVSFPGRTGEQKEEQLSLEPNFELYDMAEDPGEAKNVAGQHPKIVQEMRRAYDEWFEDVRASRGFQPGLIHIGSAYENPLHLCRYQDASYVGGAPQGWPVKIERGGRYRISINRYGHMDSGTLHVTFNDYSATKALLKGINEETFRLPQGTGMLNVWLEVNGEELVFTDNHTLGDLDVRRLE